jgi:hypothetical protein
MLNIKKNIERKISIYFTHNSPRFNWWKYDNITDDFARSKLNQFTACDETSHENYAIIGYHNFILFTTLQSLLARELFDVGKTLSKFIAGF